MKRTHTFQLKALTFLLLSFCFLTAQAQRKFRFGLGINYALPIERYTSGETRLGVYLNGTYRLADRLDVGLTASLDEPVAVPMAGVRFFKHIDLVARYYITDKKFDRLTLSLGYTF